jgi:hypothetical protein
VGGSGSDKGEMGTLNNEAPDHKLQVVVVELKIRLGIVD